MSESDNNLKSLNEHFNDLDTSVLTYRFGGVSLELAWLSYDGVEARNTYGYRIFGPEGPTNEMILWGNDLRSGSQAKIDLHDAMLSLLSFLEAWQDPFSVINENGNLFDPDKHYALDWDLFLVEAREFLPSRED